MKKIKCFLIILAILLVLPFGVLAEENTDNKDSENNEVNLYFFHGDGCGFCKKAKTWFAEIEDKYGDKFNVVEYEVWYNEENNKLMTAVADVRKESVDGVPYIIVGNQSWNGFADDYKDSIISKIESEYKQDPSERYDVMNYVDLTDAPKEETNTTARDVLILLVLVGVVGAVTAGVVIARKQTN